ncbi:hypothetical protein M9Y10_015052 [Tritrichomonas musculus]|uniref:Protein kinase domain-containing protein n=1 Tax=Tritrichomonas musculus TaxID=1915356 RepID=A0ABR2L1D9_9EUKA
MQRRRAPNPQKIINRIVSLMDQILFLIPKTRICVQHLLFLTGNINLEKEIINDLKQRTDLTAESASILNKIREACEDFHFLLVLLQKSIWPMVSLSLSIKKIFDEMDEFQEIIIDQLRSLNINIDEFGIKKEISKFIDLKDAEIDFSTLYTFYHQPSNYEFLDKDQYTKLEKQRQHISYLYNKYSIKKLDYIRREVKNPIKYAKNWKFDISKLPTKEHSTEKFYSDKWTIDTYKISKNSALVKLSIPFDKNMSNISQKKLIKRRFMLLSALDSKLLLKFVGGLIDNGANYFFQIDIDPTIFNDHFPTFLECLYQKFSLAYDLGHTCPTKIAFFVALSMHYLHSHYIIHGNLTLNSIFCINQKENTPIWNFKISTGSGSIIKRSPLEYLNDGIYSYESDVYQYGLLLYQMGTGISPFQNVDDKNIKDLIRNPDEMLDLDGGDDVKYFSPGMKKLIKDCWNTDPSKRPTFQQILYRFQTEDVYIKDPDLDNLSQFFFLERSKKYDCLKDSEGLDKFKELLTENAKLGEEKDSKLINAKEISKFLFRTFEIKKNDKDTLIAEIKHLDSFGFFEYIIPFFKIEDDRTRKEFINNYVKIFHINDPEFNSKEFTKRFLENGGADVIKEYLEAGGPNIEYAMSIYSSIEDHIDTDMEESLNIIIPPLIKAKKVEEVFTICANIDNKVAAKLLSRNIKEISPLFNDKELSQTISNLIEIYLENTETIDEISNISIKDVMSSGNISLLFQLMKSTYFLSSITNEDLKEIILTLASDDKDEEQKCCALLASLGLDSDFFEVISQFNEILDKIITINDQKLVSRFIARITKYSSACEYLLKKLEEGTEIYEPLRELREPFYLISMSRISIFNPTRAIKLPFLKTNLIKNLQERDNVEGSLRILGTLSHERDFWIDGEVPKCLMEILYKRDLLQLETKLLLSVISNIVLIEEVNKLFSTKSNINIILFIIENEGVISGLGMRILSRLELPAIEESNRRQIERIIEVSKRQLELGNEFGIEGSAEIINKLYEQSERETLKEFIKEEEIYHTIVESSRKEANPKIFIKLMKSIQKINPNHQPELTPLFSRIIMNSRGQLPTEFYELKTQIA